MKISNTFIRRAICLTAGFGALLVVYQFQAKPATVQTAISPPQYPSSCDTTTLPAGFEFPPISSNLPYDLGSLKSPHSSDTESSSDCGVFETQKEFDLFSWATFIGLNWPADDAGNPLSGKIGSKPTASRVWENYLYPSQIFKKDGSTPDSWGTPMNEQRTLSSISKHTHILNEVDEAFFNLETSLPPITDLNNAYVRYEIRINETERDYIANKKLYNVEDQNAFISAGNHISFPSGIAGATNVRGAMELKVAWKEMGHGDDSSKFYTIQPTVEQPYNTGSKPITGKTYGLVGMHIMVRTESAPEWVWATFEHVDNAPIVDLRKEVPTSVTAEGDYSFWNKDGSHSFGGFDPNVYETLEAMETKPNYYQPEDKREPSQITRVITSNNEVSVSKWTTHLNKTMQVALAGTVWENYRLISTQWPVDPGTKPAGNPAPVSLGNPVMETYMQVNGSCMSCHAGGTYGGSDKKLADSNFSFMLQRASSKKSSSNN